MPPKEDRKKEIREIQYREFQIPTSAINVAERTVELAFSSEAPVERFFGDEILEHKPSSVRLDRLNNGGPLLVNHDPNQQIGVVQSAEIGSDRIGRAVVRFGKGDDADEIFQDVVDGIRQKVSVGYQIHSMVLNTKDQDGDSYLVTDWEPFEISIVAVPADDSVGVGRSIELPTSKKEKNMPPVEENRAADVEKQPTQQPAAQATPFNADAERAAIRDKELARIDDLTKIGERFAKFGGVELARQMINDRKSVDDLNAALLARVHEKAPNPVETAGIGMTEREIGQYSFVRAIHALANPRDMRAQEAAAFEREVSNAAAKKSSREVRGIMVPFDVLRAQTRTLNVGTGTAGGDAVATNLLAGSFIDILRNKMLISQLGVTTLNGLQGNIAIPRQTGATTAYWVAEGGAPTEGDQALDQVTMSPKTVAAYTDFSRKLLIQSSIDVEALVRNDIAKVIALELDRVLHYGSGSSNQPTGIKNTTGIGTVSFAADTPTFAELVSLETKLAAANADIGNMAYVTNATLRGALKTAPKIGSTYPVFIWEDGEINGYQAKISNQITVGSSTGQDIFFGNYEDALLGFWSGLDMLVDPYSNSTSGAIRLTAFQDADVAVRHPVSFARGNHNL